MKRLTCLFFLLLMTGCATQKMAQTTAATDAVAGQNPKSVAAIENPATKIAQTQDNVSSWQMSGKIGVQTPRNSASATISWRQRQSTYAISLQGPVGTTGMNLTGAPGKVSLQTSDGKRFTANNPEQLLAQQWGYQLPVSSLYFWIRGLPVPGVPASTAYDSNHRLVKLVQQGWRIQYLEWTNVGGKVLPSKIAANSSTLTAKFVIYQWHMG